MAEYIERESLLAKYDEVHVGKPGGARKLIAEAPSVDVVPRAEGEGLVSTQHILKQAIETFGSDYQLTVAIEELSELAKELCKFKRYGNNRNKIIEEMGDVCIVLSELMLILEIEAEELDEAEAEKIERLENQIALEKRFVEKKEV